MYIYMPITNIYNLDILLYPPLMLPIFTIPIADKSDRIQENCKQRVKKTIETKGIRKICDIGQQCKPRYQKNSQNCAFYTDDLGSVLKKADFLNLKKVHGLLSQIEKLLKLFFVTQETAMKLHNLRNWPEARMVQGKFAKEIKQLERNILRKINPNQLCLQRSTNTKIISHYELNESELPLTAQIIKIIQKRSRKRRLRMKRKRINLNEQNQIKELSQENESDKAVSFKQALSEQMEVEQN